jgi:hypothetical protein
MELDDAGKEGKRTTVYTGIFYAKDGYPCNYVCLQDSIQIRVL